MSNLEQIEAAIERLPREELYRLHDWMRERFEEAWDRQIEDDIQSGALDHLAEAALAEHRAGLTRPFPAD